MRHLTTFKHRLTREAGFVLPTALIALLILTLLTGAAITVAMQTSTSTTGDDNTKAALEAAEAGLQTASYRLSKFEPRKEECITGTQKETPSVGGAYCASSGSEPLGNGATFEYWTTKGLAPPETCAGEAISAQEYVTQRCITSVGTVYGVKRRVEQRTALYRPPLFEIDGIFGYRSVSVKPNGTFNGALGTNGTITLTNGDTVTEVVLGPSGKLEGSGTVEKTATVTKAFVPPQIPIGESAKSATTTAECIPPATGEAAGKNCDFLITNGIDHTSGGVTFNAATRALALPGGSEIVLKGGIYNFCSFVVNGNAAKIKTAGERVEIFIDSAKRPESGCTESQSPAAGTLSLATNNLEINNVYHDATYLQVYVYDGSGGPIEVKNNSSSEFWGTIMAPQSNLTVGSNGHFTGAMIANELNLENNFKFTWEGRIQELLRETTTYERKAWEECPPTHTGANPGEGC